MQIFRSVALTFWMVVMATWTTCAQESKGTNWKFDAILDLYFGYDFNQPTDQKRLPFLYNHTRHDQVNLNLALIRVSYESGRFRGKLGLQQGTYTQDNYATEPKALRWINEANIGLALDANKSIWLDVGVMPSHIGFESAISSQNLTLSRSLIAENSPYFLTGAKLGWQKDENWYLSFWIANGWQIIQGIEGNSLPSVGTQLNYTANERLTLNWSTLIGSNYPDEFRRMRYFTNQYLIYQLSQKWSLIAGLDLGWEQKAKNASSLNFWSGASVITSFAWDENWKTSLRAEYYHDPQSVITSNQLENGLKTSGMSINLDRRILGSLYIRGEVRYLFGEKAQYLNEGDPAKSNLFLLGSLAWKWN